MLPFVRSDILCSVDGTPTETKQNSNNNTGEEDLLTKYWFNKLQNPNVYRHDPKVMIAQARSISCLHSPDQCLSGWYCLSPENEQRWAERAGRVWSESNDARFCCEKVPQPVQHPHPAPDLRQDFWTFDVNLKHTLRYNGSKTHESLKERFLIRRNRTKRAKQNERFVLLKSVLLISCVFWIFFQNAGSQLCFSFFLFFVTIAPLFQCVRDFFFLR